MNRTSQSKEWHQSPEIPMKMLTTFDRFEKCNRKLSSPRIKILLPPRYSMRVGCQRERQFTTRSD